MFTGSELWKNRIICDLEKKTLSSGKVIETWPGIADTFYDAVSSWAHKTPDKTAITDSFGRKYSYQELKTEADAFAAVMKASSGVRKGDHLALMLYTSAEFVIAFLAAIKLGAVAVMLPTKYKKKEICALVERADLKYVVFDSDYASYFADFNADSLIGIECHSSCDEKPFEKYIYKYRSIVGKTTSVDGSDDGNCKDDHAPGFNSGTVVEDSCGKSGDAALMMFTSGTTSLSKGVMITNGAFMHAAVSYQRILSVTDKDSTVIPVPVYMITGLCALLGMMLCAGGTVHLHQFFKAGDVLECVREKNLTFLHMAPTAYMMLVDQKENYPQLPTLRCMACGGGRAPEPLKAKLHEWLPDCEFRTVYGMTETSSPATILPEDVSISPDAGSSGMPIPGMSFKIVDEAGNELSPGEMGEILMSGSNMFDHYYNVDFPSYDNGWFHSGDVGYFSERGCLYVCDRIKDMINRGGEKIISSDVEKELLEMDGIEEAAVIGIPHDVYGEVPVAVIRQTGDQWNKDTVRSYLKGKMAGYKIPADIRSVDEIPLTSNGKYDKKNMKVLFE